MFLAEHWVDGRCMGATGVIATCLANGAAAQSGNAETAATPTELGVVVSLLLGGLS
jgi:hypothetical protein